MQPQDFSSSPQWVGGAGQPASTTPGYTGFGPRNSEFVQPGGANFGFDGNTRTV